MADTTEVYAFLCRGINGAPPDRHGIHITGDPDDAPCSLPDRTQGGLTAAGYSYWALSGAETEDFPPVLVHIYHQGALPSDGVRDGLNGSIRHLVYSWLAGEVGAGGHAEGNGR